MGGAEAAKCASEWMDENAALYKAGRQKGAGRAEQHQKSTY